MARTIEAVRLSVDEALANMPPSVAAISADSLEHVAAELSRQPEVIIQKLEEVQVEMDGLRDEVNLLRRRDETLNFYMHRLDEELRLAARLQQDFLPKVLPTLGTARFHTLFRPAGYVSGDLYDVMRLDERHVGFYIADAVGHGMPAALLTMFIKHALVTKEILNGGYRLLKPSEALSRLNEAILEQNLSQATFATAIYGMIDVQTNEVMLSGAGHPVPLILRANGEIEPVSAEGSLLGIFPGETFTDRGVQLERGDKLVLYTDGIEVSFGSGEHESEMDQWRTELSLRRSMSGEQLVAEFGQSLDGANGSLEPRDDLTMVVLEIQ
ncbi:MAG TPA: PP2C family protein-serine/threonine phosphatase [Humisphaera sp.]|jgi:serine phosphatase RsbU (regulator of sigma subunit)|nr:PP2C family protein-serine/threonine phosphatase [Humisphaera sp.]